MIAEAPPAADGNSRQFFKYALVGGSGFIVDASVLTVLVNGMGYGHYISRAASFSLAVTITWWINRQWVFHTGDPNRREYTSYFIVQLVGAFINLAIYVLTIELKPTLAMMPIIPLAIGATTALLVNFLLVRHFVFRDASTAESK